jgi:hypothetical protein
MSLGLLLYLLDVNFVLSTILIITLSFVAYIRLGSFTELELRSLLYSGLPSAHAEKIYPKLSQIIRKIH